MAPSLTYHPVAGLGASVAGAACEFVMSAARTAPKEDANTTQEETQARTSRVGLFGPVPMLCPIRIGRGLTLSRVRITRTDDSPRV